MTDSPDPPAAVDRPRRRLGDFQRLFTASTISNLGDGMGQIAYPWLASAVTRNPLLIALIVVAQRLPWLVLSLPAGVITDRVDRRRLIIRMDLTRGAITAVVAVGVMLGIDSLPDASNVTEAGSTSIGLYLMVVIATLLLGCAEVLRDNAAQTLLPSIVESEGLERANGRLWAAEATANQFAGPPLGSLLLGLSFALPFVIDAVTFLVAGALIATIGGTFRPNTEADTERRPWREDLREGITWLRGNRVLWPMALVLGAMNGTDALAGATLVIFAQEVLGAGPFLFAVIGTGGAIGAIVGGWFVPNLSKRFGGGTVLAVAVAGLMIIPFGIGLAGAWPVVLVGFALTAMFGTAWNVVTVSLRQSVIPDRLLGRVNSVYRFLAWGSIPIGAAIGGVIVALLDGPFDRQTALRAPWIISGLVHIALLVVVIRRLSTAALDSIRSPERQT
ncbi:MAG: MFS transporter [Actinobacteria bacterium]|nr:MFS transporter [Actinomycetota bacterium]MDA3010159.1 MFS transporter [Actinomycetota bacterium]